jgi:hypothetical protein
MKQAEIISFLAACFVLISSLAYSSTKKMEETYVPPECWLNFSELHSVTSEKTELFLTAAVRTSNPTLE